MNSSISSSERGAGESAAAAARGFVLAFAAAACGLALAVWSCFIALDPYDRGFGLISRPGTLETGPRSAHVSRARDPRFNAAIIGNSHTQLLSPARLDRAADLQFVQLSVPGTGPREQAAMLDWLLSRNLAVKAVVLGVDAEWCQPDPAFPLLNPFPFWLYSPRLSSYLSGVFRFDAIDASLKRLGYLLGRAKPLPADGYWDYVQRWPGKPGAFAANPKLAGVEIQFGADGKQPGGDKLASTLAVLPPDTLAIVLIPPVWSQAMPKTGSANARAERSCASALQKAALARPKTVFLDWRRDHQALRDPASFWDTTHYGHPVAELIEREIAAAAANR